MWKKIIIIALVLGNAIIVHGQSLNLPSSKELNRLSDGWHKFSSEGAVFDVEITDGNLRKGNIAWFDNSRYSGTFSSNKIWGKGTYTWPNGDKYEGSFKNNQRHGKGTMYWSDGSKHTGKWKDNFKNGKGKSFDVNGNLVKEGIWIKDAFSESEE